MSYKDISTVIGRLNQAANDLALANIAKRKSDESNFEKHARDAGESISQSIEFALRNHLFRKMSNREKMHFNIEKANIKQLLEYYEVDGEEGNYYIETYDETSPPTVDFNYLLSNKRELTNAAKHEGWIPDFQVQLHYYREVVKFVRQYLGAHFALKGIEDFEIVEINTWEQFYISCDEFNQEEHNFILILGSNESVPAEYLKLIGRLPWDLVIDFDYQSRESGFFNAAYSSKNVSPHELKASDPITTSSFSLYHQSHYHYYANNYYNSGQTEIADYNAWDRKYGKNLEDVISSFVNVVQAQKTTVVALFPSRQYIDNAFKLFNRCLGESVSYVIANDPLNSLNQVAQDFSATTVNIGLSEIASGVMGYGSNFGGSNKEEETHFYIPYLATTDTKDVTGVLTKEEYALLEENFEVLHLNLPENTDTSEKIEFLSGKRKISWGGLKNRYDVERQRFYSKYVRYVESSLQKRMQVLIMYALIDLRDK